MNLTEMASKEYFVYAGWKRGQDVVEAILWAGGLTNRGH
jgi:CxxC motif-containing protein (DUF1111 family)